MNWINLKYNADQKKQVEGYVWYDIIYIKFKTRKIYGIYAWNEVHVSACTHTH